MYTNNPPALIYEIMSREPKCEIITCKRQRIGVSYIDKYELHCLYLSTYWPWYFNISIFMEHELLFAKAIK